VLKRYWDRMETRVYQHRARWAARRLHPLLQPNDRILDIGAGDCRLDELLMKEQKCEVDSVDVDDYNKTSRKLPLFDGRRLPFEADSFDVVLLIFVLHHAQDARAVLEEARRVCRRHVIVFEDVNWTLWDRWMFRGFHRWLEWSQRIARPYQEWPPERWSQLAVELGFREHWQGLLGRQLSCFASRHIGFVWEKWDAGAVDAA
jgi:ubiquinone/menaquinone biosynthesis C-methylase UbiE